ncbi:MAG: hypothetical protein H0T73_20680 [Ardenticatenales bacterium]|nr:hypothetical protein [Ardenticatenales bacterium]
MTSLHKAILFLLVHLAVFYNIERFDFGEANLIDIQSFVYILVTAAVLATIFIPPVRRAHYTLSMSLSLLIYVLSKVFFFAEPNHPLLGGVNTYITISEIAFLILAIRLAYSVGRRLQEFEEAVENITIPPSSHRVREMEHATEIIEIEMLRSRRYHRPLAVVVVRPDPGSLQATLHRLIEEVQRTMMLRYVTTSLARVISDQLRRTDLVIAQRAQGRFIIMTPETSVADSEEMAKRVKRAVAERLGVKVTVGVASFPDNALAFTSLVDHAEAHHLPDGEIESEPPMFPPTLPVEADGHVHEVQGEGTTVVNGNGD